VAVGGHSWPRNRGYKQYKEFTTEEAQIFAIEVLSAQFHVSIQIIEMNGGDYFVTSSLEVVVPIWLECQCTCRLNPPKLQISTLQR
jgi:hypothetical protein